MLISIIVLLYKMDKSIEDYTEFIKLFDSLYLDLTILNYKFKTNTKLDEKQLKTISYLKLLIPIFNRMQDEGSNIELSSILLEHQSNPIEVPKVLTNDYFPSAPVLRLPIDNDSDEYCNMNNESLKDTSDDTSEDLEGDLQVNTLTDTTLELLKKIQTTHWAQVEIVSDIGQEEEADEEEEEEEGDEEKEELIGILVNDDTAPQLISTL